MHRRHALLPIALLVALSTTAHADTSGATAAANDARTTVLVELDPVTYALDGFSTHLRVVPASLPSWSFGAGLYALDMPSLMVDMNSDNRDEGWRSRIHLAYAAFADYFPAGEPRGVVFGAQLAVQRYRIGRDDMGDASESYANGLLMGRVGYTWRPIAGSGLYLFPWAGIGVTRTISGTTRLGVEDYAVSPVIGFATLHVGWSL